MNPQNLTHPPQIGNVHKAHASATLNAHPHNDTPKNTRFEHRNVELICKYCHMPDAPIPIFISARAVNPCVTGGRVCPLESVSLTWPNYRTHYCRGHRRPRLMHSECIIGGSMIGWWLMRLCWWLDGFDFDGLIEVFSW